MALPKLSVVDDPREVSASHHNFVRGIPRARARAIDLIRRTRYWVYDPATRTFSPSKFSGYAAMDFPRYDSAYEGHLRGTKFDGGVTHQALARILGEYQVDSDLAAELEGWAAALLGPDVLSGIDRSKWRFVRLPQVGVGGLAALAGGWEGSDELVEMVLEGRRGPGRRSPDLDD